LAREKGLAKKRYRSTPNTIGTNIITHRIDEPTEILLKDKASKW
jgi:hypothetical protein